MRVGRILVCLVIVALSAGCIGTEPGGNTPHVQLSGESNVSTQGFTWSGGILPSDGAPPQNPFDNVSVHLYDDNLDEFHTEHVGTLGQYRNLTIETETIPRYIVIWSPEFETRDVMVSYYEREGDRFTVTTVSDVEELPVRPSDSTTTDQS